MRGRLIVLGLAVVILVSANARQGHHGGPAVVVGAPVQPIPTATLTVQEVKAASTPLPDVRDLAARTGYWLGKHIAFSGTILTIHLAKPGYVYELGDSKNQGYGAELQVDVATPNGSSDTIFIGYNDDATGIYEGTRVTVYETVVDTKTFDNAFGGKVTEPLVAAKLVERE